MSTDPYKAPATEKKSGGGAMKWILIVLAILFVLLLVCVGTCWWSFSAISKVVMAPMNDMEVVLENNQQVKDKLGTPIDQVAIRDGGKWNPKITNNDAEILFTVRGPKGDAEVEGQMTSSGGKWVPTNVTVTFDDDSTIQFPQ